MWPIPLVSPGGGRSDPVIIYTGQIDGPFGRATHEVVPLRARPLRNTERRQVEQRVAHWQGVARNSTVSRPNSSISPRSSQMSTVW
jgi:hypothetical protein